MVSKELLKELQDILKEDYGVALSENDLVKVADFLVEYFDILFKISNNRMRIPTRV